MKTDLTQICRNCGHNDNPLSVSHCRNCGDPLTSDRASTTKSNNILRLWSVVPLIGVVLLSIFFFFLWWNRGTSPTITNNSRSPAAISARRSQLKAANLPNSDIQLYYSMSEVTGVPGGLFNYGGATCFAAMTKHGMHSAIAQAHPNFHLRYTEPPLNVPPGCSTGIGMLLDGDLSFAQNGRPLTDAEYAKAKARGFTLQQVPVAIDAIVFFTNRNVNLSGLSVKQLQDIFLGKVTNWKQLGGPNMKIAPISQDPKVHATLKLLLGDRIKKLGRNVKIARDYTTAIQQVAATPGGISYSSASIVVGQKSIHLLSLAKGNSKNYVSPVVVGDAKGDSQSNLRVNVTALRDGSYPITRYLFIVTRHDGNPAEQAGIAYTNLLLSQEGQQIVEKAGFAAIH
jgi:phosphate transport system substrate-binding protein